MQIREAEFKDYSAIAHLHAISWQRFYQGMMAADYLEQQVFDDHLAIWQTRLTNPPLNQGILVLENDEQQICGFVCLYGNHNFDYGTLIDNLHVAADYRAQGYGKQLIKAAGQWADKYFASVGIYLEVLQQNLPAKMFYQTVGAVDSEQIIWHAPCGSKIPCHAYTWPSPQLLASL